MLKNVLSKAIATAGKYPEIFNNFFFWFKFTIKKIILMFYIRIPFIYIYFQLFLTQLSKFTKLFFGLNLILSNILKNN